MNPIFLLSLAIAASGLALGGGRCTNPAMAWTINPVYIDNTTTNAIRGDGSAYSDGQSGVEAVMQICSGSYDATLATGRSRSVSVAFGKVLATTANSPAFAANGTTVSGSSNLNLRNLGFVPAGFNRATDEFTFTTRFNMSIPATGTWGLHFLNPSVDAPSYNPNDGIANTPYADARVIVRHCPHNTNTATCPSIVNETWFVWPDPNPTAAGTANGLPITQVANLFDQRKSPPLPPKDAGEFSMPFYFTISLLP